MKFKDNIYDFSFEPIKYEFDNFTKQDDLYDLNWITCRFEFAFKGKRLNIEESLLTTYDILNFINEAKYTINKNDYKKIDLQNIEPSFALSLNICPNICKFIVQYTFVIENEFNTINFLVNYTKEETLILLDELQNEFEIFPYRRISDYYDSDIKYKKFDDVITDINKDKIIIGEKLYGANYIQINKHQFFNINIFDVFYNQEGRLLYGIYINKKHYIYVPENELISSVHKLYDKNIAIVEYIKEIGLFKRKWFDIINVSEINLKKIKKNKNVLRVFNADKIYYYNEKYISTKECLIEQSKLMDLDSRLINLYCSKDGLMRIQIYRNDNSISYILEQLEIREEIEYGTTYNYAIWCVVEDNESHYYANEDLLVKDIEDIIIENEMSKVINN